MKKISKKSRTKKTQSKKITGPMIKKADLVMRTSDLDLVIKKLRSLKISDVIVNQFYNEDTDIHVVDFDFGNFERITFRSRTESSDEFVHVFYENPEGDFEDLLEELRPLQD